MKGLDRNRSSEKLLNNRRDGVGCLNDLAAALDKVMGLEEQLDEVDKEKQLLMLELTNLNKEIDN
jgi:hypothetical protein